MGDTQEVKREVEVVDDSAITDSGDDNEVVVPAVDEKELDKAFKGGAGATKDTTATDASVSSADEGSDTTGSTEPSIKPVEGETPRETALRKEVERLKEDRRKGWQDQLAGSIKPPSSSSVTNERLEKLRKTYSDDEIKNMEEAIDILAANRGYVKREDTYQEVVNGVLDTFITSHPEYGPSQDKDDVRWGRFQTILTSDYNLNGKSAKQLSQIFAKVHRDVESELGTSTVKQDANKLAAQQQKIKSVSHSGGTQSSGSKKLNIDPSVRKMFKGFDDEDLA